MKLKVRPGDFKVDEQLVEGVLQKHGAHRVYRVRKEKVTSLEAASTLASALGVAPNDVSMAGLKDRQGVTVQYMSVERGPTISLEEPGLSIREVGFAGAPLTADASEGNAFQIVVRDLGEEEIAHTRTALEEVRANGVPNYFDSQRFGNLRHGQGWIVLDLVKGDIGGALQRLVASASPFEPPARRRLKDALWRNWGDWHACRSIAGKLGRYHSMFEHLKRDPNDFHGAFERVATRERLIHLYAFQSHLYNRALALLVKESGVRSFTHKGVEGPLRFPREALPVPDAWNGALVMPGEALDGVEDPQQRELYGRVLAGLGLEPDQLRLPDIAGLRLKPESRALAFTPEELRVRPAEQDNLFRGRRMVRVRFALPRGAYATLVVRRLVGASSPGERAHGDRGHDDRGRGHGGHGGERGDRDGRGHDAFEDERGGTRRGGGRRRGRRGRRGSRGGPRGGPARGARGGRGRGRGRGGPRR
ncbi:MAG: tRNA pseudouridine(13) synthase TruD [Planctomycetota bacterium]